MADIPNKPLRYVLQAVNYTVFMAMVWYFATSPSIRIIDDNQAKITIAFAHAGELREPCRKLSQAELDELAPNMRKPEVCPRERSPVTIEALLDGNPIFRESLKPPGLFQDGGVDVYFSAKIPAGDHRLNLNMNDSVRADGFNHQFEQQISIAPATVLLIGFNSKQGFVLNGERHADAGS